MKKLGRLSASTFALWMLFGLAALMVSCGTDTSQLDQLAGSYRLTKITANGRDTLPTVGGFPFAIGQNEIVLNPNRYKGSLFARFQGPIDSLSFAVFGEYYLSDRSYQRTDLRNSLKAHAIIIGIDAVHQVNGAFPELGQTLRADTIARDANYNQILSNGIWRIISPADAVGTQMVLERRGINADSVTTYQMVWEKTALLK